MKKLLQSLLIMLFLGTAFNTTAQIRITGVDPAQNLIFIRNYGTTTVDVTGHMLCSKFNYFSVGSLTVIAGNPSALGSMQTAWVQGNSLDANGADLGLFLPGTSSGGFGVASNMLDFVQWKTGGNGRESVAVAKGIWTAAAFVCGDPTYTYTGDGSSAQVGVSFWNGVNCTTSIEENKLENKINLFPNPAYNTIYIDIASSVTVLSYRLVNLLGQTIIESTENAVNGKITVDVSTIAKGNYSMTITTSEGVVNKKVVITP
ncbi:MAG: hypothetical protein COW67_04915 [Flavobacteriales bacterium CG18_big_fil_WC_8_21_14_2_50_32_9]|nr:MAG: hypothetical protein COW67_04915 [Flavobacteriales bacterium CG18_big_fil_WC_8_21_14_2_50_32_9]